VPGEPEAGDAVFPMKMLKRTHTFVYGAQRCLKTYSSTIMKKTAEEPVQKAAKHLAEKARRTPVRKTCCVYVPHSAPAMFDVQPE
jgi:hypothetical protein